MTEWSLDGEEDFDFMDPTDPTARSAAEEETAANGDGSPSAAVNGPGEDDPDLPDGRSDATGAVHIWLDDNCRVANVRISNRWRERLKDRSLSAALLSVLIPAQLSLNSLPAVPPLNEEVTSRNLSMPALEALWERILDLDDRRDKLASLGAENVKRNRLITELASGKDTAGHVQVRLNAAGGTNQITLDEEWLTKVKTSTLSDAIMQAHQDAYANWREPEYEFGDHAKLAQETLLVRDEALAMLKRGS